YAAPQLIPPDFLSGRINDLQHSIAVAGRNVGITFSGITYTGQVERVLIQAIGENRVRIQLGVRKVTLTIGGTYASSGRISAQAGPVNIGIGHQRAVWLTVDVAPTIENRQLRLRTLAASFSIPPDDYFVTQPAGVSVQGFGLTQERASSGLVNGLYAARGRI